MEILLNDLSVKEGFQSIRQFLSAIDRVMATRETALQYGREMKCSKGLLSVIVVESTVAIEALQGLNKNQKSAIVQWLGSRGPFWENERLHGSDDYLECYGDCVSDTAVGEAGFACIRAYDYSLISTIPSRWTGTSISVTLDDGAGTRIDTAIVNFVESQELRDALLNAPANIQSWAQLEAECRGRFSKLYISDVCFEPLDGHPFSPSVANRVMALLEVLNKLKTCFDAKGVRTAEGQAIYQQYFTGETSWFSDSSTSEKNAFSTEMTFVNPEHPEQKLSCTYHGKVQTPQYRIHFSWPITAQDTLYIVYIGPKITKR